MQKGRMIIAALALVAAGPVFASKWVWVPSKINANRGDAVLSADPDGAIGVLLGSIHQTWTHSGMVTDSGYTIRHNTMYMENVEVIYNTFLGINTTPKSLNGTQLRDGNPGIITESTANAYGADGIHSFLYGTSTGGTQYTSAGGVVLKPKVDSTWRTTLNTAASKMEYVNAYYRVYAYTVMAGLPYQNYKQADKGNHCSGTIWHSVGWAGAPLNSVYYSPTLRQSGASVLYNSIVSAVSDDAGWFGNIIIGLFDSGAKARVANQVVNCFAFNDCWNTNNRWSSGVGSGQAVSPDNLLPTGYANTQGYYWGYQDPNGPYGKVDPLSYVGGYWKQVE